MKKLTVKKEHLICWAIMNWPDNKPMTVLGILDVALNLKKNTKNKINSVAPFINVFWKLMGHVVSGSCISDVYIKSIGKTTYKLTPKGIAFVMPLKEKLLALQNDATVRAVLHS